MMTVAKNYLIMAISGLFISCTTVESPKTIQVWDDPTLDDLILPELRKFANERELKDYLRDVHRAAKRKDAWWVSHSNDEGTQYAQMSEEECEKEEGCASDEILVTGSRVKSSSQSTSITNNQKAGVDEGDIVKNYGRFIIVLQDGRLFSVDTGTSAQDLKLVDRINVYRDSNASTWFDEMLIYENRIVVTGYSYEEEASELAIVQISPDGKFIHEATFFLTSDDYYDIENYASRLVNGNLVLHTPLNLIEEYDGGKITFPKISKWTKKDGKTAFKQLYHATDVYYPIQKTIYPTMHAVSVCPLNKEGLHCKTTAVIAPSNAEYYVSEKDAYLWISSGVDWWDRDVNGCNEELKNLFDALDDLAIDIDFDKNRYKYLDAGSRERIKQKQDEEYRALSMALRGGFFNNEYEKIRDTERYEFMMAAFSDRPQSSYSDIYKKARKAVTEWKNYQVIPSAVYQFSIKNAGRNNSLKAVFTKGMPSDQFALETNDDTFRALVEWEPAYCYNDGNSSKNRFVGFPLAKFKRRPVTLPETVFAKVPVLPVRKIENRFTADYLVYGGRESWSMFPPHDVGGEHKSQLVAVPLNNPTNATQMSLPHNVIRIETIGENIIATGYQNGIALSISSIDMRKKPKLADTKRIWSRYESEGRSHAFNADIDLNGSGIFGLPTVTREKTRWGWWSYSDTSDVSFLTLDANLKLTDAGRLNASVDPVHGDYDCEVSCVDWYGNTRPIFLDGRIFALSATELIEGNLYGGRMVEIGRVNMSAPVE